MHDACQLWHSMTMQKYGEGLTFDHRRRARGRGTWLGYMLRHCSSCVPVAHHATTPLHFTRYTIARTASRPSQWNILRPGPFLAHLDEQMSFGTYKCSYMRYRYPSDTIRMPHRLFPIKDQVSLLFSSVLCHRIPPPALNKGHSLFRHTPQC